MPTLKRCPKCGQLQSDLIEAKDTVVAGVFERKSEEANTVKPDPAVTEDPNWVSSCSECGYGLMPTLKRCPKCGQLQSDLIKAKDTVVAGVFKRKNEEANTVKPDPAVTEDPNWVSSPPTPWRRYWARVLDLVFNGVSGMLIFGVVFAAVAPHTAYEFFTIFETPLGRILDAMCTAFFASLIGGALIGVSGMTLGKWIFGIKVQNLDGSKLGLLGGIRRDLDVFMRGMSFGIPLISLITIYMGYSKLTKTGETSWDSGQYSVCYRRSSPTQTVLNIIGVVMIAVSVALARALAGI
jgi:uncharacterized RDD family membrane protein YckC